MGERPNPGGLPDDFEWGKMPPGSELANMNTEAISIHEVYSSNLQAGFTPEQAIYLTACLMTGSPGNPPPFRPPSEKD